MPSSNVDIVTGAFGYSGKYITRRLLAMDREVKTLTSGPISQSPFGDRVPAMPFCFDDHRSLVANLRGAATLYNTYWVRFPHRSMTFQDAIYNTRKLIRAAREAGVGRMVHVSITNPSKASPLPYFRGKALLEEAIIASKLSYAIVRPTVIFGFEDILINNIAYLLRTLPVFGVFGRGDYPIQPVFVEDFAQIAVEVGQQHDNMVVDAVGPETYCYMEMVQLIRDSIGSRAWIVPMSPSLALAVGKLAGFLLDDVVITREEIEGLMSGLLVSHRIPTARTRLSAWLMDNANALGRKYSSELRRHFR